MNNYTVILMFTCFFLQVSCIQTEYMEEPIKHETPEKELSFWKSYPDAYKPSEKFYDIEFVSEKNEYVVLSGKQLIFLDSQFRKIAETSYQSFDLRGEGYINHILPIFNTNFTNQHTGEGNLYQYELDFQNRRLSFKHELSSNKLLGYTNQYTCTLADQYSDYYNPGLPVSLFFNTNYKSSDWTTDLVITRKGNRSSDTTTLTIRNAKRLFTRILSNKRGYVLYNEYSFSFLFIPPGLNSYETYHFNDNIDNILVSDSEFFIEINDVIYTLGSNGKPEEYRNLAGASLVDVVDQNKLLVFYQKSGLTVYNLLKDKFSTLTHSSNQIPFSNLRVANNQVIGVTSSGITTYPLK